MTNKSTQTLFLKTTSSGLIAFCWFLGINLEMVVEGKFAFLGRKCLILRFTEVSCGL